MTDGIHTARLPRRVAGRVARRLVGSRAARRASSADQLEAAFDVDGAARPGADSVRRGAKWPSFPPAAYLGQLEPRFQAALAEQRADVRLEDCDWYHTFELSSGEVVAGAWDLRGKEDEYLGHTAVSSKRVLEVGPASGFLTYHMERHGAEVVAFEAGFDVPVDLLPFFGQDMREEQMKIMEHVDRVHNAWWFVHKDYGSAAKLVHGRVYDMPGDLGQFDVAVFGAILLHLRDPFGALAQAARRTRERVVVTDLVQDTIEPPESNVMRFAPLASHEITNWWAIYPGAVVSMLGRLGFGSTTVTFHEQRHHLGHKMDEPAVAMPMFTVVGERV
jgi:O-methyltransferase